jgi:predicted RNase H-like HicB family nuclease
MANMDGHDAGYLAIVRREACTDGSLTWLAYHPDLPGCMAHAETPEEALVNLGEARSMVLSHLREHGIEPPCPGSSKLTQAILAAG